MKLRIGFVVIALATTSAAFAQSRDPTATSAVPSSSRSAQPGANAAASSQSVGVRASPSGTTQSQAFEAETRAERDQAEARITAQLNRQQLVNVTSSATSARSQPLPQTATRPSDCPMDQPNCLPDVREPQ
jgi:hypothetical protein